MGKLIHITMPGPKPEYYTPLYGGGGMWEPGGSGKPGGGG